jgi:hypothetical protein
VSATYDALLLAGENQKSGPIGFAVILVLCIACYFLFKSMSKHLRKVREQAQAEEQAAPDQSAPAADEPAHTPDPADPPA